MAVYPGNGVRGCSSMAELQLPKLIARVRFPSSARVSVLKLVETFARYLRQCAESRSLSAVLGPQDLGSFSTRAVNILASSLGVRLSSNSDLDFESSFQAWPNDLEKNATRAASAPSTSNKNG